MALVDAIEYKLTKDELRRARKSQQHAGGEAPSKTVEEMQRQMS
jgi:hypothetical protein